jgi:hypothetical protein
MHGDRRTLCSGERLLAGWAANDGPWPQVLSHRGANPRTADRIADTGGSLARLFQLGREEAIGKFGYCRPPRADRRPETLPLMM